jgi:hypothetical protein
MTTIRNWLAAALLAAAIPAHAGKYSDLWFNPEESGWGMNVVQQGDTAFVTLFVYGADGKPAWYVAPAAQVTAIGSGNLPLFRGMLYRTEGPAHTGPFDPSRVKAFGVGELFLETLSSGRIRVTYTTEGTGEIVKEVQRQTWQLPPLAANYTGQFILRLTIPGSTPFGTHAYHGEMLVGVGDDGQAFMRVDDALGPRCEYRGPLVQSGRFARITGTFGCIGGDFTDGTFEITDFEVTEHGISGFLRKSSPALNGSGRFAAVRQ